MPEWYVMVSDERVGPVDQLKVAEFIRSQKIGPNSLVWKEGMKEWAAAGQVEAFRNLFAEVRQAAPAPATPPDPGIHRARTKSSGSRYCRNCGESVDERAVVCLSCGADPIRANHYCQECGSETHPKAIVCVKCGCKLASASGIFDQIAQGGDYIMPPQSPQDPLLMALLSGCCLAWLGQIILGQTTKGLVMLAISITLCFLAVGIFFWPIAAVDAYLIAKKLKEGKPVKQWEFF